MKLIITFALLLAAYIVNSQENTSYHNELYNHFEERPEVWFAFQNCHSDLLPKLSRIISIDQIEGCTVIANANQKEFAEFLRFNLPFEILPHTNTLQDEIEMRDQVDIRNITNWNFYPTYEAYIDMMNQFETDYSSLCEVFSIGTTVQGRDLMMARIAAPAPDSNVKPQFLYTGTMHGDELTGYNLLLRLIDYLLVNYGVDPKVTQLLDNVEIWINPNANPDGTYFGGNHTVWSSTRRNANNIDLNRNFPDPKAGPHPDGNPWQPETIAFMQLAEENNFVMSANTHGGAEVLNYPWDTWQHLTADNNWWMFVCREYVDTVHVYSPSSYYGGFDNGITNGYAWYSITGGRQDYMNYFHHCREVTLEMSNTKKLPTSQLETHWQWNYRSLLNYIAQCTYGISGFVTDINTGEPVAAKLTIEGHDLDNSHVYSEAQYGFYQRLLDAGTYNLTFTAPGFQPVSIPDISVARYATSHVNVQMDAGELDARFSASATAIPLNGTVDFSDESFGNPVAWDWTFQGAEPAHSSLQNPKEISYPTTGRFDVTLTVTNNLGETSTLTRPLFIKALPVYQMSNTTLTTCGGIFYDTGGQNGNYSNNENIIMTFLPDTPDAAIKVEFLEFSLEPHNTCNYDFLKIFDGTNTSSNLIGTFCGSNSPGTITADNPDGALTFWFKSDYSVTYQGWKALISCHTEQHIQLNAGWSGLSSFVIPENTDIEATTSEILQQLIILASEHGAFFPDQNIKTLESWAPQSGYLIKMSEATTFTIAGEPLQNKTIFLKNGWNILPVLSTEPLAVATIHSVLTDNLILIKEVAGFELYWPDHAIQSLIHLHPGKSYYLLMQEDVSFTFPQP
jgi:PKD repeat protein